MILSPQLKPVLNAGAGSRLSCSIHPLFAADRWHEIRIDIDAATDPDVVCSITDMRATFAAMSFDAIWSSHVLEHLYVHEVPLALLEFRRMLKPDGFALITSPDLEAAAAHIIEHGLERAAYTSPAGPITALDMLYGHGASIARGHVHMAHKSGFTCASLGRRLVEAGFPTVLAKQDRFDLWAVALMEQADKTAIQLDLAKAGINMFDDGEANGEREG
jgi:SAM-dependent methyltransferase